MKPVLKASLLILMFVVAFGGIMGCVLSLRAGDNRSVNYTIIDKHTSGRDHYELVVIGVLDPGEAPSRFYRFAVPKSLYDAAEIGSTLEIGMHSKAIIGKDNSRVSASQDGKLLSSLLYCILFGGFWCSPSIIWILNRNILSSKIFIGYTLAVVFLFFFVFYILFFAWHG